MLSRRQLLLRSAGLAVGAYLTKADRVIAALTPRPVRRAWIYACGGGRVIGIRAWCDGYHDDTPSLQMALDVAEELAKECSDESVMVKIPAGDYQRAVARDHD